MLGVDALDLAILNGLQRDGRMSNRALAELVGLSPSACLERVRRLRSAGFIEGFGVRMGKKATEGGFEAWARITLARPTEALVDDLVAKLADCEYVIAAYELAGEVDIVAQVLAPDAQAWRAFARTLEGDNGVSVRTSLVIRTIKHATPLPLEALWSNATKDI